MSVQKVFTIKTAIFYTAVATIIGLAVGAGAAFIMSVVHASMNPGISQAELSQMSRSSILLPALLFVLTELIFLLFALRIKAKFRNSFRDVLGFKGLDPVLILCIVTLSALYLFPSSELENICSSLIGRWDSISETLIKISRMPGISGLVTAVLITAVLPAVVEEIFFRGLILRNLSMTYGNTKAIIISSLLFTVIHINPTILAPIFILSLMFGFIYVKTGNLAYTMVLHFTNNFLSVLLFRYDVFIVQGLNTSAKTIEHISLPVLVPVTALTVAMALLINKIISAKHAGPLNVRTDVQPDQ